MTSPCAPTCSSLCLWLAKNSTVYWRYLAKSTINQLVKGHFLLLWLAIGMILNIKLL
jgi:hypothetical protein